MMEKIEKKPVALWKGIFGTVLSLHLFVFGLVFTILFIFIFDVPGLLITGIIVLLLSTVALVINAINLIGTIKYKKQHPSLSNTTNKKEDTELLHKLLNEGKITIEEYDQLRKKK